MQLEELLAGFERLTGLGLSIYPAQPMLVPDSISRLPAGFRRHMRQFCQLVKAGDRQGCKGHDAVITNIRAGQRRCPFVQRCHAGVAEVVVPVIVDDRHLATVFVGQVVTEAVAQEGFAGIWRRVGTRSIKANQLRQAYSDLPRMTEQELLHIGRLVDCALQGMVKHMSAELLERQLHVQNFPQIHNALRILQTERCWQISQAAMARRVHVSTAYFSRLFKRVIGRTFSDYLTSLRMREAQNLLQQTRLPVNVIASKLGYARQSYFSRRFRAETGLTPSAFRGSHKA